VFVCTVPSAWTWGFGKSRKLSGSLKPGVGGAGGLATVTESLPPPPQALIAMDAARVRA